MGGMSEQPPDRRPVVRTVMEPVTPEPGSFDPRAMARGEPGVPRRFSWRGTTYVVAEVLGTRREVENYSGSDKDTYARRHVVRVRTESGEVMSLSATRGARGHATRWILREMETSS
jgi:hypothetical protein